MRGDRKGRFGCVCFLCRICLLNRFNPLKNLLLLYLYNVQFFTPSSSIISAAKAVLEDDSVAMKAISQFPTNKLINYVSTGSYRVRVLNHSLLTQ